MPTWYRSSNKFSNEPTGGYWIAFQLLEEHGFKLIFVNARYTSTCALPDDKCQRYWGAATIAFLWAIAWQLSLFA